MTVTHRSLRWRPTARRLPRHDHHRPGDGGAARCCRPRPALPGWRCLQRAHARSSFDGSFISNDGEPTTRPVRAINLDIGTTSSRSSGPRTGSASTTTRLNSITPTGSIDGGVNVVVAPRRRVGLAGRRRPGELPIHRHLLLSAQGKTHRLSSSENRRWSYVAQSWSSTTSADAVLVATADPAACSGDAIRSPSQARLPTPPPSRPNSRPEHRQRSDRHQTHFV